jgi:hypothetical protein
MESKTFDCVPRTDLLTIQDPRLREFLFAPGADELFMLAGAVAVFMGFFAVFMLYNARDELGMEVGYAFLVVSLLGLIAAYELKKLKLSDPFFQTSIDEKVTLDYEGKRLVSVTLCGKKIGSKSNPFYQKLIVTKFQDYAVLSCASTFRLSRMSPVAEKACMGKGQYEAFSKSIESFENVRGKPLLQGQVVLRFRYMDLPKQLDAALALG